MGTVVDFCCDLRTNSTRKELDRSENKKQTILTNNHCLETLNASESSGPTQSPVHIISQHSENPKVVATIGAATGKHGQGVNMDPQTN